MASSQKIRRSTQPSRVSIKPYGSERYPDVWLLDWRLDWKPRVGPVAVRPTLNVFNALNSNTVVQRHRVQNSQAANRVVEVLAPRSIRFDVVVTW